jgi:hypothetical protein
MGGLLAPIVLLKAINKRLEVVRVHRRVQPLHNNARIALGTHGQRRRPDRAPAFIRSCRPGGGLVYADEEAGERPNEAVGVVSVS